VSRLREDGSAGVIFTESDQGFVEFYYFDDADEMEKIWQATVEDLTLPDDELEPNSRWLSMSDSDIWERMVGSESPSDFVACARDKRPDILIRQAVEDYAQPGSVDHLSDAELAHVRRAMVRYIARHGEHDAVAYGARASRR
jgi:hypothetical protein